MIEYIIEKIFQSTLMDCNFDVASFEAFRCTRLLFRPGTFIDAAAFLPAPFLFGDLRTLS